MSVKKYGILMAGLSLLVLIMSGCQKQVITVAGIQDPELTEENYIAIEDFELKDVENNGKEEIDSCVVLIPAGYVESQTVPGMYVHERYPLDSSNIYYTVCPGTGEGTVSDILTQSDYEKLLEKAYKDKGEKVDVIIQEFKQKDMDGIPGYEIRSYYELDNKRVEQLTYIIQASDTHVITYSQLSDDELLADFEVSEGEIKLVRK